MPKYDRTCLEAACKISVTEALKYLTSTTEARWGRPDPVRDILTQVYPDISFREGLGLCAALQANLAERGVADFGFEGLGAVPLQKLWSTQLSQNPTFIPELRTYEMEREALRKQRIKHGLEIRPRHQRIMSPAPYFVDSVRKGVLDIPLMRDGRQQRVEPDSAMVALDKSGHVSLGYLFNHPGVQLAFVFGGNAPEPILRLVVALFDDGQVLFVFSKKNVFFEISNTIFHLLHVMETSRNRPRRIRSARAKRRPVTAVLGFSRNFGHTIINDLPGWDLTEKLLAQGMIDKVLIDEGDLASAQAVYRGIRTSGKVERIKTRTPFFLHSRKEIFVKLSHQSPLEETTARMLRSGRALLRLRGAATDPEVAAVVADPGRPRLVIGIGKRNGARNPRNERQFVLRLGDRIAERFGTTVTLLMDGMTSSLRQFQDGQAIEDAYCNDMVSALRERHPDSLRVAPLAGLTLPEKLVAMHGARLGIYPYGSGMVGGIFLLDLQVLLHGPPSLTDNRSWDWHIEPLCRPGRRQGFDFLPLRTAEQSGYEIDVAAALQIFDKNADTLLGDIPRQAARLET